MFLDKIKLINFKNLEEVDISFSKGINCLLGENGSGKTNLLDSIYTFCLTKSAFTSSDSLLINFNKDFYRIEAKIELESTNYIIECAFSQNTKKILKVNSSTYEKASEHIGKFPVVMIAPDDTDLIREGSETRRKFFDAMLCQLNDNYLSAFIQYNHLLKQRNALIKSFSINKSINHSLLETYDEKIIALSMFIASKRNEFLKKFIPVFNEAYSFISPIKEKTSIKYDTESLSSEFKSIFKDSLEKDLLYQRTTKGIHTDDFEFKLNEVSVKRTASQGQKKSFVISLKIAQYNLLLMEKGIKSFLLLDDIFDKLDDERISRLIELISNNHFGQIFITDARPERSINFFKNINDTRFFEVKNGNVETKS